MPAENNKRSHLCAFSLLTSVHMKEMLILPTITLSTDTAITHPWDAPVVGHTEVKKKMNE
jgi:hypothetical protein